MTSAPRYLTVNQVADVLQVNPWTIRRAIYDKRLRCIRFSSRCIRVPADALETFLASLEVQG